MPSVDEAGHQLGALTPKYASVTQQIDQLIPDIEKATRDFFQDDLSTFVFTSDHGFPDVTHHGGAEHHCRRSPFVVWNHPFLKGAQDKKTLVEPPEFRQIEMCSVLSGLLGVNTPSDNTAFWPKVFRIGQKEAPAILVSQYGQHVNELRTRAHGYGQVSRITGFLGRLLARKHEDILANAIKLLKGPNPDSAVSVLKPYQFQLEELVLKIFKSFIAMSPALLTLALLVSSAVDFTGCIFISS